MFKVKVTFYDELVDFFSATSSDEFTRCFESECRSIKDLIESMGVPHTELGQVLVDGKTEKLSFIVRSQCHVQVYPFPASYVTDRNSSPAQAVKFCCDVHLGTLTKRLRLLGMDTVYDKKWADKELAEVSIKEGRYLLTRDRQLLMRKEVTRGLYIRNTVPERQVFEVVERLNLKLLSRPFSRCLICNGVLKPIMNGEPDYQKAEKKIPPKVKHWCREFARCITCEKVYWKGSHYNKLKKLVDSYLG